jgi:arylsulfatase A-like enzyme
LLTGRYQQRFGHEFNPHAGPVEVRGLSTAETTIADRFRAAGYKTGVVGKWHLGTDERFHPLNRGFDEFYGFLTGSHDYFLSEDKAQSPIVRGRQVEQIDGYLTDVLAREANSFVERHRKGPFLLYLAFNAVHTPMHATDEYLSKFAQIADPRRRTYAAMTAALDDAVGKVMGKLRESGLEQNTLVFFFSDNGGPTTKFAQNASRNDPLRGSKGDTWEGGIRVPFFIRWPAALPQGKTVDQPVIQLDILPTALAAAGVEAKPEWRLDGVNLLPLLKGQTTDAPHDALYWRFGNHFAIRQGDWKVVRTWDNDRPQLFNLAADISETTDLSAHEPQRLERMLSLWKSWNSELAAPAWPANHPLEGDPSVRPGGKRGGKR